MDPPDPCFVPTIIEEGRVIEEPKLLRFTCYLEPDRLVSMMALRTDVQGNMPIPNFAHDVLLVDSDLNDRPNLIIRFGRDEAEFWAELYDDQDDDGEVSYEVVDGEIVIRESPHWTIRLASEVPWDTYAETQFNLTLMVDGNVEAMFGSTIYQSTLTTDGVVDFTIEVKDVDSDGRPDYELRQHHIPERGNLVGEGFHLMVNWGDTESIPNPNGFWPYLGAAPDITGSLVPKPSTYRPPILVDWENSKIVAIGEFVASRAGEDNCFIYGTGELDANAIINPGFENPFCFYDLAGDLDGVPELQIRSEYWPARDWRFVQGQSASPMEWIRYSWDQDNDGLWDYGLGLAGRHPYTTTITFGEYEIRSIPYDIFPRWVIERPWDEAVFVDATGVEYRSSEGIYEAQVPRTVIDNYLTGLSDERPAAEIRPERAGIRVERAPNPNGRPELYLSPVDHQLHLVGAEHGALRLDDETVLLYEDLDGDGYLDQWIRERHGAVVQQLNVASPYLIYVSGEELTIKLIGTLPAPRMFAPPDDYASWQSFGSGLTNLATANDPGDLAGWTGQFDGSSTEVQLDGAVHDFRLTENGFRFVLELTAASQTLQDDLGLGLVTLQTGDYIAKYEDDAFSVEPLTPAELSAELALPPSPTTRAGDWVTLDLRIANKGTEDMQDVLFCAQVEGGQGYQEVMTETVSLVTGSGQETINWRWAAPSSGAWTVKAGIGCDAQTGFDGGQGHILVTETMLVENRSQPPIRWLLTLGERTTLVPAAVLVLLAVLSASMVFLWTRLSGSSLNTRSFVETRDGDPGE